MIISQIQNSNGIEQSRKEWRLPPPARGDQEGAGIWEPERRAPPVLVSWVFSPELHLFSLWWRWGGSGVGSPTSSPSCKPAPAPAVLVESAALSSHCLARAHIPPPLGGDSQEKLRPRPPFSAHFFLPWTISTYPFPSAWTTSVSPKQSTLQDCLPSWTSDSLCQRPAHSFLGSP